VERKSCSRTCLRFLPSNSPLQIANTVQGSPRLLKFLNSVLPDHVPYDRSGTHSQSREELIKDVFEGVTAATMAIRIT
jgi:lysine 2,3-aminomutase